MAEYKNNIKLGVVLESAKDIQGKLDNVITTLNNSKINLDINIKDSNVAKQLENLTNLAKTFKSSLGGNVSLGDIDKVINQTSLAMTNLNDKLQSISRTNLENGLYKQVESIATGIGQVTKLSGTAQKIGDDFKYTGQTIQTTTQNLNAYRVAMDNISKAQRELKALESNGFVDIGKISDLRNTLSNVSNNPSNYSDKDLSSFLNQVKELTATESKIIDFSNKINTLKSSLANLTDSKFENVLNKNQFEQIANQLNQTQSGLKNFDGINLNGLKQQFNDLNNLVSTFTSETISAQKAEVELERTKSKQEQEKIQQLQKEIDMSNKLVEAEQKRQVKDDASNLKKLQEEQELLLKQAEAYKQIDVLKANGIINGSDIARLEQMVKSANSLKDMNKALNSIMNTSMMNESSIVALSKQLDDAQIKLNKMKQTFGTKLPQGFIESTEKEINKLKEDLTKVDGMNFNGIKNSLNQINNNMKVTSNETQQLVNSLKQTNGNFFSGITNFLGKIGVFYGVQQVFQEITDQFKKAGDYTIALDRNLSNIQMITGRTRDEVVGITNQFKELGAQLHTTNQEMLAGSENLMRAGYTDEETEKMMESAVIGSKVSGQTVDTVSEQLITLKNSFDMSADSMSHVIDIFSKMDNTSATSFKEIASAIQRTAYSAQEAGVPLETLTAYITTTSEKTRRSAETIGESYKTIFSRYQNIKLGKLLYCPS